MSRNLFTVLASQLALFSLLTHASKSISTCEKILYWEICTNCIHYRKTRRPSKIARKVQFKDCIDVFNVLFPNFDFIFLFDHSNGHNNMQPNSLNANKISICFDGKQPHMRDAVIDSPRLLGPFHTSDHELQLGSSQKM